MVDLQWFFFIIEWIKAIIVVNVEITMILLEHLFVLWCCGIDKSLLALVILIVDAFILIVERVIYLVNLGHGPVAGYSIFLIIDTKFCSHRVFYFIEIPAFFHDVIFICVVIHIHIVIGVVVHA